MSKFCEKRRCDWFTSWSVQAQDDKMTVSNWGVAAEVLKRSRCDVQQLAFDVLMSNTYSRCAVAMGIDLNY